MLLIFFHENLLPVPKNRAIELSKGEYIAIIYKDDISLTKILEKQVNFLDEHKDIWLV